MTRHHWARGFMTAAAVLLTMLMPVLASGAEAEAATEHALYLIVVQPKRAGGQDFDVTKHGGTLKHRLGSRLAVMLPEQAVQGVRQNPNVRYME